MLYTDGMVDVARRLLRIPRELDEKLSAWAAEEDRSVNSLMVHLLRLAVLDRERRKSA